MPKNDRQETRAPVEDASVHLKPILGIRPGTYLSVFYGVVLLLLVYLFLFLPGLRHRGSYLALTTYPDHANVTIDGTYAGSTPCTIFMKKGQRSVEISRPFYTPVTLQETVSGRVFATLLVMDRKRLTTTLSVADVKGLSAAALLDFQKNPGVPQIVSDAAEAAFGTDAQDTLYGLISSSMLVGSDDPLLRESQLRELLLGASRIAAHGSFLSQGSLVSLVQHVILDAQTRENYPAWLYYVLSRSNQAKIEKSDWLTSYLTAYKDSVAKYYQPGALPAAGSGGRVSVGAIGFHAIPSGDLVMGKDENLDTFGTTRAIDKLLAHPVHVDAFYLGDAEVSNATFLAFVQANPDWAPSNRDALMAKGTASDAYLADWAGDKAPAGKENLPVTNISWYAASAFCAWLSERATSAMPGYVAQLPSEAEWEWAARGGLRGMPYPLGGKPGAAIFYAKGITGPSPAGASEANAYGLRDMLGNVWEWCGDAFSPNAGLLSSFDPRTNATLARGLTDGPDRAVRGGSWADQSGTDKVYTRGAQPAEWCTPYLGFRVALVRR